MKKQVKLQHPYPSIGGSFGGSQSWFQDQNMNRGGCGVVAAGDLLLYLGMYQKGCRTELVHGLFHGDGSISRPRYEQYLQKLRRRWFPILPRLGMPYWVLMLGLNGYFRKYHIPLKARWGVLPWKMEACMEEMLSGDLPVILAIGPNFPLFFQKKKLNLYRKDADGREYTAQTSAHFVTVTGMGEGKVQISSWGKAYTVDWKEYKSYVLKNSNYLMSNLCYIKRKI